MAQLSESNWLEVIGKALSYLSVQEFSRNEAEMPDLIAKVQFLERLGIPLAEAAGMLGTTSNSVQTNLRQRAAKAKGGNGGKKHKK